MNGNYPLHLFCSRSSKGNAVKNHGKRLKRLIEMWPDALNLPSNKGRAPFHEACRTGNLSLIVKLFSSETIYNLVNSHINVVDHDGHTPLHLSVNGDRYYTDTDCFPIVQFLLNHPLIIVNHRNNDGKLPLDMALESVHRFEFMYHEPDLKKCVSLLVTSMYYRRCMAYEYVRASWTKTDGCHQTF
jgi:ankyrin repeat protein